MALRHAMLGRRRRHDGTGGPQLQANILEHPWWISAQTVALYLPIQGEPPTDLLVDAARRGGKRLALPRVEGTQIGLYWWLDGMVLGKGVFGLQEPPPSAERALVGDLDLLLVPGLAFDRNGGRLGFGKGHYDRLLSGYKGRTLGVAWEFQIVEAVPMEVHDVRLGGVVTENDAEKGACR